jgi:hypothetical protein
VRAQAVGPCRQKEPRKLDERTKELDKTAKEIESARSRPEMVHVETYICHKTARAQDLRVKIKKNISNMSLHSNEWCMLKVTNFP